MTSRRLATLCTTLLVLAAPAAALAQSAGDDQYEDPFAGQEEPTPAPTEETGTLGDSAPGLGSTPPSSGGGNEDTSDSGASGTEASADDGSQLPRTGGETGLIALMGAGMVMAGSGLRLRLRTRGGA